MTTYVKAFSGALALALVPFISAKADATYYWTGGGDDTNFDTTANWGSDTGTAYPVAGDGAMFIDGAAGKTVTFNGAYKPSWAWAATGTILSNVTWIATDASYGMTTTYNIGMADATGQTGALRVESGTYTAGGGLNFGSGTGIFTMTNGTMNAGGVSNWAAADNAVFMATISGGTINFNGAENYSSLIFGNGESVQATVTLNGGTLAVNAGDLVMGASGSGASDIVISDGGRLQVGDTTERWLKLGAGGAAASSITVNEGGTLAFWHIEHASTGACALTISGGTLEMLGATRSETSAINPANDDTLTVTVDSNGGTLKTGGNAIVISKVLKGSGTLNVTGGGSVTFTAQPECAVSSTDETTINYSLPNTWTGAADNNWANDSNWSHGTVPAADEAIVIDTAAEISIDAAAYAGTITLNANATLTGGSSLTLGAGGISGTGTLTLAGVTINSSAALTIANNLVITADTTNVFRISAEGAYIYLTGSVTGSGAVEITQWRGTGKNANAGVQTTGDWTAFAGSVKYYQGTNTSNGALTYQQRAVDTFTPSATSENASWDVYATQWPDIDLARNNGHFFATGGTADSPAVYKFGSLQMRLPKNKNDNGYSSYVMLEVGKLDAASSLLYSWAGASNCGVKWIAPTATFSNEAANTAYITLSGGGNVSMTSDGVPTALNFTDDGGYVVLTSDATLNASIISAITTVDDGATVGFYYKGETAITIDLSDKASLLAGKTVAKKGSGTIYINGLPSETVSNIAVNGGTMILPHGVAVGTVTVASGAVLNVDMAGASDGETVFSFTSISSEGTVEETNLSSRTQLVKGEASWTATILGDPVAYTWCGYQDNNWATSGNWMTNGVITSDIPTASDTAEFTANATLTSSSAITTPVTVSAGTLTVSTGMTFASLTVAEGAKIAFSNASIATVGGTLDLITVNSETFSAANCTIPANYTYSLTDGVLTATRAQSTYTWAPQGENTGWATSGNWTVEGSAVAEVPALEDYVEFPASTEEGFEAWAVTLPWDVYATTMTLSTNVTVSGGYSLRCPAIGGEGQLRLAGAHLNAYEGAITVSCPLHIVENTSNTIWLSGKNVYITGALTGSGTLISNAGDKQYTGVKFSGDVSGFAGTFEATNYAQRDATDMTDPAIGSENAVWKTNPHPGTGSAQQSTQFIVHSNETVYKFGAYVGGFWVGSITNAHVVVGNRSDVASSFSLTSYGSRAKYVITKVGSGEMTITNTKGDPQIGTLYPNGGTTIVKTTPDAITFNGDGMIKTPAYDVTENEVTTSYYPDVSGVITGSSGPIAFTNDKGEEHTWAGLVTTSNKGGLSKYGSGKLTITQSIGYEGITSVFDDGILEIDTALNHEFGSNNPVNALSTGTITGAVVTAYAYPAGTTLYGTEEADDYLKVLNNNSSEALVASLDFSGVTAVDVSAKDLYDEENNKFNNVVLARTTGAITGIGKVGDGLNLILPDRPDGVAEGKWQWTVRTTVEKTVDDVTYHCVTVTPKSLPFVISIQ